MMKNLRNISDLIIRYILALLIVFLINWAGVVLRGETVDYLWILFLSLVVTIITVTISVVRQKKK